MTGRKPLYDTDSLEIGEKLRLPEEVRNFKDQYLYTFRKRAKKKGLIREFQLVESRSKLFVERIA